MKMGLILIDIQNDYFKGGKNELFQPEEAGLKAKKVLSFFREKSLPVLHIQHISMGKEAGFFIPETYGVEIYKEVYPKEEELVIIKHNPDSFFQTKLKKSLEDKSITHLVICGMMTHMCVDTTIRAARNFGYNVTLIEDACATKDLVWAENIIPASTVQRTFMASLNTTFANRMTADQWIKEQSINKAKLR